jgi:hypothetical protein
VSKHRTLTHDEREQFKNDYLQAHRLVFGYEGFIKYRRGWWYLMSAVVGCPFSTKEIAAKIEDLRKQIPQRADSDDDGEL